MENKFFQLKFMLNDSNYHNCTKYSRTIYLTEKAALRDASTAWDEVKSCGDYLYEVYCIPIFLKYGLKDIFLRGCQDA